jgi:succinoglycan biosynthesis transport protein ExoP
MNPGDRRPNEPITIELDHTAVEGQARVRPELSNNYRNAGSYEYGPVQELRLRDYLGIIEKRKGMVALVFFVILGLTAAYTFSCVPIYRAEAVLEVGKDSSSSINDLGQAISQSLGGSDNETFATQTGILKSRFMAEALLDRLDLGNSTEFRQSPGMVRSLVGKSVSWFEEIAHGKAEPASPSQMRERLIKEIASRVTVKRENQSRLIRVTFDAKDPKLATTMLDAYVGIYMDQNLAKRRMVSRDAASWLKSELTKAEGKYVKSMNNLVQFTNEHGMVSLDDASNHILTFFNKAAEGLVKSKEQRVQLQAFQNEGIKDLAVLPPEAKADELKVLKEKLAMLESEHNSLREIYNDDYPKLVLLRKQITFLKEKLADSEKNIISAALETAKTQEVLQQQAFEKAKGEAMASNSLGVQFAVLKRETETNNDIYKLLLQKSKELELSTQIIGNNIIVVDRPTAQLRPVKPKKALYLLIGCVLGLTGGILVAFALEQIDNSVHSTDDLEKKLGLPALGVVPDVLKLRRQHHLNGKRGGLEFLAYDAPKSPVSEAIKNIKTSIFLSAPARSIRTLVISSSGPREGKTFTSVSIASVLCSEDKKVLIIDADLRRPRLGKVFGHSDKIPGLTTLLTRDDVKLQKVLHKAKVPGLYYITSGPLPPNPVALLESERMDRLTNKLAEIFDLVIFDSPPVVGFSDARILAANSDAAILVVKEAYLPVEFIQQAKTMVMSSGRTKLLGAVLNMANGSSSYYGAKYTRYYRYYDYSEKNGNRFKNLLKDN